MEAEELLKAVELLSIKEEEYSYRAQINRYYYAVYHKADRVAKIFERQDKTAHTAHEKLIKTYRQANTDLCDLIANDISAAKKLRILADYKLNRNVKKCDVNMIKFLQERVFRNLKQFENERS